MKLLVSGGLIQEICDVVFVPSCGDTTCLYTVADSHGSPENAIAHAASQTPTPPMHPPRPPTQNPIPDTQASHGPPVTPAANYSTLSHKGALTPAPPCQPKALIRPTICATRGKSPRAAYHAAPLCPTSGDKWSIRASTRKPRTNFLSASRPSSA